MGVLGAYELRNEAEDALRTWRGITDAHPGSADAYAALSRILQEHDMFDQALEAGRKAVEFSGNDPSRWRDLANMCVTRKRFDEAIAAWEKVAEHGAQAAREEAWEQIISIHQSRGRLNKLVQSYLEKATAGIITQIGTNGGTFSKDRGNGRLAERNVS